MKDQWIDENSQIPAVLQTLKNLLKGRGLYYHDVAQILRLSETTVKRYLTGHGLTVEILERLCKVVDLRLSDILEMAQDEEEPSILSLEEERQLAQNPFLASLFYLLAHGLSPATLQRDLGIGDAEMNGYLTTLDRLGLIKLFPFNRVSLRIGRNFTVQRGGPLMRLAQDTLLKDLFERFDVTNPDWLFAYAKLSDQSLTRVRELLREFLATVEKIADADRDLPIELAQFHALLLMLRPIDIAALRKWPGQEGGKAVRQPT